MASHHFRFWIAAIAFGCSPLQPSVSKVPGGKQAGPTVPVDGFAQKSRPIGELRVLRISGRMDESVLKLLEFVPDHTDEVPVWKDRFTIEKSAGVDRYLVVVGGAPGKAAENQEPVTEKALKKFKFQLVEENEKANSIECVSEIKGGCPLGPVWILSGVKVAELVASDQLQAKYNLAQAKLESTRNELSSVEPNAKVSKESVSLAAPENNLNPLPTPLASAGEVSSAVSKENVDSAANPAVRVSTSPSPSPHSSALPSPSSSPSPSIQPKASAAPSSPSPSPKPKTPSPDEEETEGAEEVLFEDDDYFFGEM